MSTTLTQPQLLRSRKTGLSAKLTHHGITLNHAVLDDHKRHLCAPPKAPTRIGRAIATLQEVMDDLGETVALAARYTAH